MINWLRKLFSGTPVPYLVPELRFVRPENDNFKDLPEEAVKVAQTGKCPFCWSPLYDGPRGGASQNMYCSNVDDCNSAFNISFMIPWGQFLGHCPQDFKDWVKRKQRR